MAIIWIRIRAAICFIRDAWNSFLALIFEITRTGAEFSALVDRIMAPEFPIADPIISFWQTNPTFPELIDHKSEVFPDTADIVIIGSGISGASIAYTILSECRMLGLTKRVVVLEARNTCSGATGRNGGHLKFSAYTAYADLKSRFGLQSAKKIMNFQQKHLPIILDVVETERLKKTDAREVETVDMFIDSDMWGKAKKMVLELKEDLPEFARDIRTWESEEARKKFGFSGHC